MAEHATSVTIEDCWDRDTSVHGDTSVHVETPMGKIACVISEIFNNASINLFAHEDSGGSWDLPSFVEPEATASDEDDAVSVASGGSGASSTGTRPRASSQMLSSALRARLQGTGSASSAPPPA